MKRVLSQIFSLLPFRLSTKLLLRIFHLFDRFWSHAKFKTLVKDSGQSVCHWTVEIKYGNQIKIGDFTSIAPYACIGAKSPITIGNYVRISRGAILETAGLDLKKEPPYKHKSKPIIIEDGVWIASNAIILGGVTIGKNAIIGAGVVVTKDVMSGDVVVGQSNRILDIKIKRDTN